MKSLDMDFLREQTVPIEMSGILQSLGEYKGRQELHIKQTPQVIQNLRESAMLRSAESSCRIEGVEIAPARLKILSHAKFKPQNRSEQEVLGYKEVLSKIHIQPESFTITPKTLRDMHHQMFAYATKDAGHFKPRDNTIEQIMEDGRWVTRFEPVSARQTPYFVEQLCERMQRLWESGDISKLILIPTFILDFLCIHPFTDGNGRISRLLTVLLLHQAGYTVGRYISLEQLIEVHKNQYYDVLGKCSQSWHTGQHRLNPFWEFNLGILLGAYRDFEDRVGEIHSQRGAKTSMIINAVDNLPKQFMIADLERNCPTASRDMIRVVLKQLRAKKQVRCLGTGRSALWERV